MEENKNLFTYIGQIFTTYGIIVAIFVLFCVVIGNGAQPISSLYSFGSEGLSVGTLAQLLLLAVIITFMRVLFLTDRWIKNMALSIRSILFLVTICLVIAVMAAVFEWFKVTDIKSWIGFIISFFLCSTASVFVSRVRENCENKKMEQALKRYNNDK